MTDGNAFAVQEPKFIDKLVPADIYESVAMACHSVNRAWCLMNDDGSQLAWDIAPDNIKASVIDGLIYLAQRITTDGRLLADRGALHENWVKFKRADGWKYGKVKDTVQKTHHCLVPFHHLNAIDQTKDDIFMVTAHMLLVNYIGSVGLLEAPDGNSPHMVMQ